ncbi:MAG TPA: DUF1657 domain-containing protein [Bacillota bacterium]|jgi:hypothetical protein|nr:DUF1657 domain-containing protein [Peptococcaceae bacterium MAG4]NLW38632.1 DUF1657 domain-containing protein [Peptococcaceae bacterium]HPU35478.1 DUF1657 domain-containing protein [Bacillota bacterium]HPZ43942.1 DUF1657 domain-containing protein [Bacillota bacterium]HQD76430.1 DUF1657 domain-containing protein [Bacillota bacterium]
MTVGAQVKQTLAELKGIQANLETFAQSGGNEEANALLLKNARRVGQVIEKMEKRLSNLEFEEPQYKGF